VRTFEDAVKRSSSVHVKYADKTARRLLKRVQSNPGISARDLGQGKQVANQISWLEIYGLIYYREGWFAYEQERQVTNVVAQQHEV